MTTTDKPDLGNLLLARMADVRAKYDAQEAAVDAFERAEAALKEARAALHSASPGWGNPSFATTLRALDDVRQRASEGGKLIAVTAYGRDPLPGVIVKATKARVTVLTERGEMEFDLNPRSVYGGAGQGRGEFRSYSIDPGDL